jgi:hypothetical protein
MRRAIPPPPGFRLLVCGGRDYADRGHVFATLDRVTAKRPIGLVIHGAARGADTLAGAWATERKVEAWAFPANWQKHGKAAGHLRNQAMLTHGKPNGVVAFPGGSGTADMVARANSAGITVMEVRHADPR